MDELDRMILEEMRGGIPLVDEPYRAIAQAIGIEQEDLLARLARMKDEKLIRRFGASINQHKLGINANAVVAWKVPQERIEEVAGALVDCGRFSHCYERIPIPGVWDYNLYTVIHDRERSSVKEFVQGISEKLDVNDYAVFFSTRNLKTTSSNKEGADDKADLA